MADWLAFPTPILEIDGSSLDAGRLISLCHRSSPKPLLWESNNVCNLVLESRVEFLSDWLWWPLTGGLTVAASGSQFSLARWRHTQL